MPLPGPAGGPVFQYLANTLGCGKERSRNARLTALVCTHLCIFVAPLEIIELSERVCHFTGKTRGEIVKSIGQTFQDGSLSRPAVANHTNCPTAAAFSRKSLLLSPWTTCLMTVEHTSGDGGVNQQPDKTEAA